MHKTKTHGGTPKGLKVRDRKRKASFNCEECDEKFTYKRDLKEHMSKVHVKISAKDESLSPPLKKERRSNSNLAGTSLIKERAKDANKEKDIQIKRLEEEVKHLESIVENQNENITTEVTARKKIQSEYNWQEEDYAEAKRAAAFLFNKVIILEAEVEALKKDQKSCYKCTNLASTKENPQEHTQSKHNSIGCNSCEETFPTKESLDEHNSEMHINLCDQCSQNFLYKNVLLDHVKSDHQQGSPMELVKQKPSCNICGITRNTQYQVDKHIRNTHNMEEDDSSYNCNDCSYQCMSRDVLKKHIETAHRPQKQCKNCDMKFTSRNELNFHISEHHKSHKPCTKFANSTCEFDDDCRFKHIVLLETEHICYKCGNIEGSKTSLLKHIKAIHGNEPCQRFKAGSCPFNSKCLFTHTRTTAPSVARPTISEGPYTNSPQEFPPLPEVGSSEVNQRMGMSIPVTNAENPRTEALSDTQSEAPHTKTHQGFRLYPSTGDNPQKEEVLSMMAHIMTTFTAQMNQLVIQMTSQ